MKRLNITLPDDIANDLNKFSNKSRFISEALREKIGKNKKEKLENLLVEGYLATRYEDKAIAEDWDKECNHNSNHIKDR